MNVSEAVESRMSCRAFSREPVPGAVVRAILEAARRAPSGGNLQPWHVYALAGEPLRALLADIREKVVAQPEGEGAEFDVYPKNLEEPYRSRRFKCGEDLYATECTLDWRSDLFLGAMGSKSAVIEGAMDGDLSTRPECTHSHSWRWPTSEPGHCGNPPRDVLRPASDCAAIPGTLR